MGKIGTANSELIEKQGTVMEFLTALSVLIAALSFVFGVTAWSREFRGKRRMEMAENVLAMFYEAQEAIKDIRSPASYVGEGNTRPRIEGETDEEQKIRDSGFIPFERYKRHEELFSKLRSTKFAFMAMFGTDEAISFNELTSVVNQVLFAGRQLGNRFWLQQGRITMTPQQVEVHLKMMAKYEALFWEGLPEEDNAGRQVQAAVVRIERVAEAEARASEWWGDKLLGLVKRSNHDQ
jgi:hypothetical protein